MNSIDTQLSTLLADSKAYELGYSAGMDVGLIVAVWVVLLAGLAAFLLGRAWH